MDEGRSFLDPRWRLNHLYKIVDKESQRRTFKENIVQKAINQDPSQRKLILKARQFGVSTNEILKLLDFVLWNDDVTACIIAHEQDAIQKLFRIARRAYEFLDDSIKPELDRGGGSKYEMFFPEPNSRIYCDLESRGDTIQRLHVSECAFIKDFDKLKATLQAVPIKTGCVTVESTPNGLGNEFYEMWSGEGHYSKLFFPWFVFPEYQIDGPKIKKTAEERALISKTKALYDVSLNDSQLNFRRFKKTDLKEKFVQEYPEDDQSCFLASGDTVMDLVVIKDLLDDLPDQDNEPLQIFRERDLKKRYVVGADTAEGVGGDFSVATVFDIESLEQVAILRGQLKPSDFAHKIKELCQIYTKGHSSPLLAIERNNHGHAVLLELGEHIGYNNLFRDKDNRPGWITDRVTRPIMLDAFIQGVENQTVRLSDRNTLRECLTLVNNKGKIQAADNKHDDCIMAASIAIQLCIKESRATAFESIGKRIKV